MFKPVMRMPVPAVAVETKWYQIKAADDNEAHLYIYDVIDSFWGVSAEEFVQDLNSITAETIIVHLNTPGGSVWEGMAIYNALKNHKAKIITQIDSVAASMGSIIALAGEEVRIAPNAFVMIHSPWVFTAGNARELREAADFLDKIAETMVEIYVSRMQKTDEEIRVIMSVDTWFSAQEALDAGFATEIMGKEPDAKALKKFDLKAFGNVPPALKGSDEVVHPDAMSVLKTKLRARLADAHQS